ncbi:hypothetical protein A3A60_03030 [Candidatus Curtissbacteria bacterium RIFCSPLOWO2_01_FULL_42_26]|uniref:Uncharacterized protein n=1 Tax=Candidatus Curtissbacteria bacterium RIFCSPLOWO2_01_FULL_42_26 TaxID=1797729 RepID=A0A1F5I292_9BACT|nr:MAG: hypothetical protein A3A60_03030 [Candidatus Curtissbacteria bacterium RIFCSPLOWO2_01_FULL_42_26]
MNRSWYTNTVDKRSPDTVHQILAFGTLDDIRSLKKTVGDGTIRKLFLSYPKKVYTQAALGFVKNFILHITGSIDEAKYLKNTPRSTRQ